MDNLFNGTARFRTNFDGVGQNNRYYNIEFNLINSFSQYAEKDYHSVEQGELIYKCHMPREDVVFDINQQGELDVISEDAFRYFINQDGELCYELDL